MGRRGDGRRGEVEVRQRDRGEGGRYSSGGKNGIEYRWWRVVHGRGVQGREWWVEVSGWRIEGGG